MNSPRIHKWLALAVGLAMIGVTGGYLARVKSSQRLAPPGVRTAPLTAGGNLQVVLPETVLDYTSEWKDVDEMTLKTLPKDTSYGARLYTAPDGFQVMVNVVLMGRDRTSLHKPQFCLNGQGWAIDNQASAAGSVTVAEPLPYPLPVVKLVASRANRASEHRAIYVYWYVADDTLSASVSGFERMWSMAQRMFRTGELQRWAYVSCLGVCMPGQEAEAYERMTRFIAAAAPGFQLYPAAPPAAQPVGP